MYISNEEYKWIEKMIYLPMLLVIVRKDLQHIQQSPLKFKQPYTYILEEMCMLIDAELKKTKAYMQKQQLRVERGEREQFFTEYYFYKVTSKHIRRYSNIRLRNVSEQLFSYYFSQVTSQKK